MADFRIPGPQCSTTHGLLSDDGTLCRWLTPPRAPVCREADPFADWVRAPARQSRQQTRVGGWPASSLAFGPEGTKLLKAIETLRLKPYDDQTNKDISNWVAGATIGYGHLIASGDWSTYAGGITEVEADALFDKDVAPTVSAVGQAITVGLQQYEFDALVIFAFNIGINGFKNSSVVKLINDPQATTSFASLEAAWKAWNKSQGKVNKGVQNRRDAEWKIYTLGVYERW